MSIKIYPTMSIFAHYSSLFSPYFHFTDLHLLKVTNNPAAFVFLSAITMIFCIAFSLSAIDSGGCCLSFLVQLLVSLCLGRSFRKQIGT